MQPLADKMQPLSDGQIRAQGTSSDARADRIDGADVVFVFSYVTWQAAGERGWFMPEDRLALALLRSERVGRVLVCDPLRSLPVKLARERMTHAGIEFPASAHAQLVQPLGWRRRYPTSRTGVERRVAGYERMLLRGAQRLGLHDPAIIVTNPLVAGFADFGWARAVTFYAFDDWTAYPPHRRWWPVYRESFDRVASSGRRVAAVSRAVLERVVPTGPSRVIPNGLEPDEWTGPATPPDWLDELPRPLLLYAGTLDARLDVGAVAQIARALPEATLLLVGPLVNGEHLSPLRELANVQIRPSLARKELTGLVRSADVGLVPHVRSMLTEAMSPLKLYEYLAAGLPVLATDLEPMRAVAPERVMLVPDGGDYATGAHEALGLGRAQERERMAFVQGNAWTVRHEQLFDLAFA